MPRSAIATGCIDFVLSPEEIARKLCESGTEYQGGLRKASRRATRPTRELRAWCGTASEPDDRLSLVVAQATLDSIDIDRVLPQIAALKSQLGAVTGSYSADRQAVIRILNEVLPTEIVCVLRYKRHYYMATGIHAQRVARNSWSTRTRRKLTRILRPNGSPLGRTEFQSRLASRSHSQYAKANLLDMVREDLVAERIAVESYNEIIRYLGNDDPPTRIAMEQILSKEEEHADDMKKLLETLSKDDRFAAHA